MLFMDNCNGLGPVVSLLKSVLTIIQWGVPILLIVMGSIDLGKAVLASDDKEIKGATSKLIKRAIAAVAVFFIPMIVNLIINLVAGAEADGAETGNFAKCWNDPKANGTTTGKN